MPDLPAAPATPPSHTAEAISRRAAKLTQEPAGKLPITFAEVFIGALAWVVTFSGLLAWAGRRRTNWWQAAADVAGGATLICFAVALAWRLTRPHV